MSDVVISVKDLGKSYRLGQSGTGTLAHDLNRYWSTFRGKPDPTSLITKEKANYKDSENFHALRNVSIDIQRGDVLGLIGRNGAGKSTLLKILSQITSPTSGFVGIKGRLSSLLEVGTGFHLELTGRENVFLNGAILGMTKLEIKSKFDEIVAFSGVEKFIDTPVKRYSSGMLVRLGFAVAAHLEPEVLLVDEVLAVGDMDFQKKCLGKMNDVSKEGRTIIFVSHNMQAISQLCTRGVVLNEGKLVFDGAISESVKYYLMLNSKNDFAPNCRLIDYKNRSGNGLIQFFELCFKNQNLENTNQYLIGDDMVLDLTLVSNSLQNKKPLMAIHVFNEDEIIISNIENTDSDFELNDISNKATLRVEFKNLFFYPGKYKLGFWIGSSDYSETFDHLLYCADFFITEGSPYVRRKLTKNGGLIYLTPKWSNLK